MNGLEDYAHQVCQLMGVDYASQEADAIIAVLGKARSMKINYGTRVNPHKTLGTIGDLNMSYPNPTVSLELHVSGPPMDCYWREGDVIVGEITKVYEEAPGLWRVSMKMQPFDIDPELTAISLRAAEEATRARQREFFNRYSGGPHPLREQQRKLTCSECYGTGLYHGIGAPCSKGCKP